MGKIKWLLVVLLVVLCAFLLFDAFSSYINPYQSVSEVALHSERYLNKNVQILGRIHGLKFHENGSLSFELIELESEKKASLEVFYAGIPPQNIREGQRVVVVGKLMEPNRVNAEKLLTKCPSKYA
ncbi:MAG: cytochrome c maturation protein CcmE [Candidatus Methanospirare jalkutatii]|nr:cytochrome c maturation protein CcmE [Candidatus Methanospirare jalkutatii]